MKLEEEIAHNKFKNQYHKAAVNLIYTTNWLQSHYITLLKPYNITMQQYNVLRILRGQYPKPAPIKLVRERMLDKMSDASRLVEKLRQKELVERKVCETDRRNADVIITRKGLNVLEKLDHIEDGFRKQLANLSTSEVKLLNELLDKMRG